MVGASKDNAIRKRAKGTGSVENGKRERCKDVGIVSVANGIVSVANEKIETFRDAYVQVLLKSTLSIAHEDSGRGKFVWMLLVSRDLGP